MEKLIKVSDDEVRLLGGIQADEVWKNDQYLVAVLRNTAKFDGRNVVHLSIKRPDLKPITDWNDKQAIKNQLVGCDRCLAGRQKNGVTLWSRRGNLFTGRFPENWNLFNRWVNYCV